METLPHDVKYNFILATSKVSICNTRFTGRVSHEIRCNNCS